MLGSELFRLKNDFSNAGIIFCYSGYFTEGTVMGIGDAIKKELILDDTDPQTLRIIFSIFVEQVQNIIHYSAEKEIREDSQMLRYGILTVGREDEVFFYQLW